MSLQSEGTMTSEDDSLEDVVLELMKEKGILSQVKGQIAKFINDSGRINTKRFIIAERADEKLLSYIYEYLQWIGMKQTCSVLLSESPVKVDHSIVNKKPDAGYRPKLQSLFDNEVDAKFLSFNRKTEQENLSNSNNSSMQQQQQPPPPTKRLDDLLIEPPSAIKKSFEFEDSFLTSTPNVSSKLNNKTLAAADATFIKEFEEENKTGDSSKLLMGFNTPLAPEEVKGHTRKSFVPERLFQLQNDPFLAAVKTSSTDNFSMVLPELQAMLTRDTEIPTNVTKSEEQFLQDEEEVRALEDQQEDLERMEEEVMESSLSTDWSEEERENVNEPEEKEVVVAEELENDDENPSAAGVDRSKAYEVSDDFEEDKDTEEESPHKLRSFVPEEDKEIEDKSIVLELVKKNENDLQSQSLENNSLPLKKEDIKNVSNKSPQKKSDADDLSTSDMLSLDMEDEDTQDVSIKSDDKGMSSCEHVVSIK